MVLYFCCELGILVSDRVAKKEHNYHGYKLKIWRSGKLKNRAQKTAPYIFHCNEWEQGRKFEQPYWQTRCDEKKIPINPTTSEDGEEPNTLSITFIFSLIDLYNQQIKLKMSLAKLDLYMLNAFEHSCFTLI